MKINFTIAMIAVIINCFAQEEYVLWSFETGDRVLSHPVVDEGIVYFGSNDNHLYAIDASSGEELWSYSTAYDVLSSVLINENRLYFESGNNCYALDKTTGEELWMFLNDDPDGAEKLDPWDYHHGSPVIDETTVYFGCGDGRLYGFDKLDGELQSLYEANDSSAIRSTPVIQNGILYFGDWNGIIYALDILTNDTVWTHRTYETQPYATFGMVNTQMIIHDTLLIFGARNPELQVLNIHTGEIVWDYIVADGGWISGDPLVHNDTLYIGGSDCNMVFAFDVHTGELYWDYTFLYNNFSKPIICGEYIIFTTGNAYAYQGTNYGTGYLYALNKNNGTIHNFAQIGGNLFTSPAFYDSKILVGSSDKHFYAIDSIAFLDNTINIGDGEKGYHSFNITALSPNPFKDSIVIEYSVKIKSEISIRVLAMTGSEIKNVFTGKQNKGNHKIVWDGRDNNNKSISGGYYLLEIYSGIYKMSKIIVKQ